MRLLTKIVIGSWIADAFYESGKKAGQQGDQYTYHKPVNKKALAIFCLCGFIFLLIFYVFTLIYLNSL